MTGASVAGQIRDVIIDPETGHILAILLNQGLFSRPKIVSSRDTVEWYKDGALIRGCENVLELEDIVKVKKILDSETRFFGSRVVSESGKYFGQLRDFVFDTTFRKVATIIIRRKFSREIRIMSADRIVRVLPGKIIIKDHVEKVVEKITASDFSPVMN